MSIQAVAWALDQDLPARPKLVLVSIANHANHTDGYCWLKAETIAAEAACSPRAVFNFVGDLIRNGFIRKAPRKGDDGKQRANDYWILFNRPEADWVSDRTAVEQDAEAESEGGDASAQPEGEAQDVASPDAPRACGSDVENPAANPVEMSPGAVGPHAPACSRSESAEPSKTNPENARARASVPRGYRPPPVAPPKPQGSTTVDGSTAPIFVYAGTDAYKAWARYRERERRAQGDTRPFNLKTTREGKWGWYFPSLFPPPLPDPPRAGEQANDIDNPFEKTG